MGGSFGDRQGHPRGNAPFRRLLPLLILEAGRREVLV